MFRDELIGDLLQALPHPFLNYDRWILELDPKESNRRQLFGEQASAFEYVPAVSAAANNVAPIRVPKQESNPRRVSQPVSVSETAQNPEMEYSPVEETGSSVAFSSKNPVIPPYHPENGDNSPESPQNAPEAECLHFAQTGLEPVSSVWDISPMQDDIEHLQSMVFRLAFELAEMMGCDRDLLPVSDEGSAGFCLVNAPEAHAFSRLLLSLTGENTVDAPVLTLTAVLFGTPHREEMPLLDDTQTVKFLRLLRVIRRLRELQRAIAPETIAV